MRLHRLTLLFALACPACLAPYVPLMPRLARAEVSNDFDTYEIRRVGLLPFQGENLTGEQLATLQRAFLAEASRSTPYEIVVLDAGDLEMIEASSPHRRGWYRPKTVIQLSKRYTLDAVFFGAISDERFFPPQLLSFSVDMVSAETGLVVWSSSIHLDANDPLVIDGLKAYYASDSEEDAWKLALISPERFARFAAYQVACLL